LKNKNILIVGGTGFIGYHLAKESLLKGLKVTSFSTKPPIKIRKISKIKYIFGDISKKNNLSKLNKDYSYVVNLGGYVDHTNKKKTYKSHYIGCKNLCNFFLKKKIKSFIQIGSGLEYGFNKSPQKENLKCKPKSVYAKAKYKSTNYVLKLFKKNLFPATVLRFYQVYGTHQDKNRLIPIVIDACVKNKTFPCSDGNQFRDFIHIKDIIRAIFQSIKRKEAKGQIINIGSGKPFKVKNVIKDISTISKGGLPEFGKIKLRKEESLKIYPDIKKAKNKIKWVPRSNFKKEINKLILFYKNNE